MTVATLASLRETPGLDAYLDELEERLERAVAAVPGDRLRGRRRGARRRRQAAAAAARLPRDPAGRGAVGRGRRRGRARPHGDARPRRPDRPRRVPARPGRRLVGARPRRRAGGRRLPLRPRVRRAGRDRRRGRSACLADATLCLARGEAMQRAPDARPRHDGRELPRALRAEDREALRGRVPARRGRRRRLGEFGAALGIAFQIADDILDCAGRDGRDRQDRRHRPARGDADAAADLRGARGRGRARARSPAGRSTARSCASPRPARSTAPARSPSPTRSRPAPACELCNDELALPTQEELEAAASTYVVVRCRQR